ncbi:MAG TPA: isoprenylcysteine carboxylmethyltransferase family protein [Terracidiphilus sp.]|nr:isoprenylcysteine carboxylmethyltransferase family protein [Terracidiphilus sp.]
MSMRLLWACLVNGWIVGEVVIAFATRTRNSHGSLHDRGTQLMIWIVIVGSFVAAGYAGSIRIADIPFNHPVLREAALALLIAGLLVRVAAIVTLGRAFSANVAIRSSQTIQRSGLYSIVRHPSYLGMEMIFLAFGLHSHNWASMAIAFIPPTLAILYRIHVEEAALIGAFGSEYDDYRKSTKRLIPGVY